VQSALVQAVEMRDDRKLSRAASDSLDLCQCSLRQCDQNAPEDAFLEMNPLLIAGSGAKSASGE
jgi:hypothetical protein